MANSMLPLICLYTEGREAIDGATRFQKLVFLAQSEGGLPTRYHFHADKYGPYSHDLREDLEELRHRGYIEKNYVTNNYGHEKHVFSLTRKGVQIASELAQQSRFELLFERVGDIKSRYNDRPLPDLLRYVYQNYSDYTTETNLDLDELFDPETDSEYLEQGEPNYAGQGPDEALEMMPSPEELFSTD